MTTVAIVHDYLTQRGGAERVVLCMLRAFPDATLHTSLYHPAGTFPEFAAHRVQTTSLNRIGAFRRNHRLALPVLASTFSSLEVDADVVLCSSSGWAHGVRTTGRKVVYCYSPPRWIYTPDQYLGDHQRVASAALGVLRPWLKRWDANAAATADRYMTLSSVVRDRIRTVYGIEAEVLPPPPAVTEQGPAMEFPGIEPGFFLCVSRLLPYKNVDSIVAAFASLPGERLVVIGSGPDRERLEASAPPNVSLVGSVPDEQLRWAYRHCAALVAASYEDYGLTPLEAGCFGKPVATLKGGGYLDTVVEGCSGVFFHRPTAGEIADAVGRVRARQWDPDLIRTHVEQFSEARFVDRLQHIVAQEGASATALG